MVKTFVRYSNCIEYLHTTAGIVGHSCARAANGRFSRSGEQEEGENMSCIGGSSER
jgi:hypothetical protein